MAGVRQSNKNIVPISKPKGLPNDLYVITQICADNDDAHSHSWLDKTEIREVEEWWERYYDNWIESQWGYLFGNSLTDDPPPMIQDVRIVFWFDN